MEPSYSSITIAVAFAGVGYGPLIISSYARAFGAATKLGFSQDINTNMMISGMFQEIA